MSAILTVEVKMKRVIPFMCVILVMLSLVACPHVDPSAPGTSSGTVPSPGSSSFETQPTLILPGSTSYTPTISTMRPTLPTTLPTIPTTRPTIPTTLPTIPTTLPTVPTEPNNPGNENLPHPTLSNQYVVADCQNLALRKYASKESACLANIPVGGKVEVISWQWSFAKVRYNGITGYVMSSYIRPVNSNDYMSQALDSVEVTDCYTYSQMMEDLRTFALKYPDQVQLQVIGESALGREIPVIRIGDVEASKHVLIHGSIHGREHMTTWLIMAMLDYWLDRDLESYGDVCFHVIPMVNPDGVTISQTGQLPDELLWIYESDRKNGYTNLNKQEYAQQWKANGQGVDLNRQFPAKWEEITDKTGPSAHGYKGEEPFCAPESIMLRDYTHRYSFDVTISYHAMGNVIYYDYGDQKDVNDKSKSLGSAVSSKNGYYMIASDEYTRGGYKDWAIGSEKIPSLTIEIGCERVPLAKRELYTIFIRNLYVMPAIAKWIK